MGFRIKDLQAAALPLSGTEIIELEQGENSRQVRVMDLLPGFDGDTLAEELASMQGARKVGWLREPLKAAISTAGQVLDAQGKSIWEFAHLVTVKPVPDNPGTWDWTPAFMKACEGIASFFPIGELNCAVIVPPGIYPVTKFLCGRRVQLYFAGGSLTPFDKTSSQPYMIKAIGYSRVYNLAVDMDYAINYDTVFWFRGRHIDLVCPEIWKAKCCFTFGDPAWSGNPAQGVQGDSECNIIGGDTIWCVQHSKVYGQNTIVTYTGGHRAYSFQNSLPDGDSRRAAWMALEPVLVENWGGLVYITGSYMATFTGQTPMLRSHVQPISGDPAYKNSYGRFYLCGNHIETGRLLSCAEAPSAYPSQDTATRLLTMTNCNGYLTGNPSWMIDTALTQQGVHVSNCNFYGAQVLERIAYAPAAPVHIGLDCFANVKDGDVFAAMYALRPVGYPGFNLIKTTGSAQSFTPSFVTLVNPVAAESDLVPDMRTRWVNLGTGLFTAIVPTRNLVVQVGLSFTGSAVTDTTTIRLLVNGSQVDIAGAIGYGPNVVLRTRRLRAGDTLQVQVSQNQSRASDGSAANKIIITADI